MTWYAHNPDVVSTELEEGAVLLNMETRTYYSLNSVGLEAWRLVETARTVDDVAAGLLRRFDGDAGRARELAGAFLDRLCAEGLLVARDAGSGEPGRGPQSGRTTEEAEAGPLVEPQLIRHDEPLHEIPSTPFDPQLPLAE